MKNINSVQLSVRIDVQTDNKIKKIVADTGQTKSQVVKKLLNQSCDIEIKDGSKIASELFKIRCILEKNTYDEKMVTTVKDCCDLLTREIYKFITKGGADVGDLKSD